MFDKKVWNVKGFHVVHGVHGVHGVHHFGIKWGLRVWICFKNTVHFLKYNCFGLVWFYVVKFGSVWFDLVLFGLIWVIRVGLIK